MALKNKVLETEGMKKGDELVGQIYDDLHTLMENDKGMSADIDALRNDLQGKISAINIGAYQVHVDGTAANGVKTGERTLTNSQASGSRHITRTYDNYSSANGIGGGTYSISAILNELVRRSHYHVINSSSETGNCNCNCNCSDNDEE